jgi:hypothetical protein
MTCRTAILRRPQGHRVRFAVGRFPALLLAGALCSLMSACGLVSTEASREAPTPTSVAPPDAGTQPYLETMSALGSADPARQADVFYEIEREYTRAPTTASTLRYAVALITSGHPASNAQDGKRLLESLLATPERMTQQERVLAAVTLQETNTRLKLEAEIRRLLATLDDRGRSQANSDKRMQAQLEENARLRRALTEAQQKLEAVKDIERSTIERSPSSPGNRDASSETQTSSTSR